MKEWLFTVIMDEKRTSLAIINSHSSKRVSYLCLEWDYLCLEWIFTSKEWAFTLSKIQQFYFSSECNSHSKEMGIFWFCERVTIHSKGVNSHLFLFRVDAWDFFWIIKLHKPGAVLRIQKGQWSDKIGYIFFFLYLCIYIWNFYLYSLSAIFAVYTGSKMRLILELVIKFILNRYRCLVFLSFIFHE